MATWIAHLRIAENLLDRIEGLDIEPFALGNIAPDSGIPDEKWEKFDPPTEITHFKHSGDPVWNLADLDFYRRYLLTGKASAPTVQNGSQFAFLLGYFFHLVTDNLWHEQVGIPTKARYPQEFAQDSNFIWEVKLDWYGQDFCYLRAHPNSFFERVFMPAVVDDCPLDFLPLEALRQQAAHIRHYYQRRDPEILQKMERPFIYLSREQMDSFIEQTSLRLEQIYRQLWLQNRDVSGFFSALQIPLDEARDRMADQTVRDQG